MEKPTPDKSILKKIKNYDVDLFVEWDVGRERWALKRKDLNGTIHHIFFVQNDDGSFRPLDERVMHHLYECDIWKHFKNGADFHKFIQSKNKAVELNHKTIRQDYLRWWNKEHRKEWKAAIENAQRGILWMPEERERKIYSLPS